MRQQIKLRVRFTRWASPALRTGAKPVKTAKYPPPVPVQEAVERIETSRCCTSCRCRGRQAFSVIMAGA